MSATKLPLPFLGVSVALGLPLAYWGIRTLTRVPNSSKGRLIISPGLSSIPPGPVGDRVKEIYPEDVYGEETAYAPLPTGKVKYALCGPKDGKKVVLIHGLTMPSIIFKEVVTRLADAGFRVLTYDLYGRGYSDAPHVDDTPELYTNQLALLLQYLTWSSVRLVGLSMGGAIAAAFAVSYPWLVDGQVVFIASAGTLSEDFFNGRVAIQTSPLVAPFISRLMSWKKLPPSPSTPLEALNQLVMIQLGYLPRSAAAVASSIRQGLPRGSQPFFQTVGVSDLRLLIIHGTADSDVPFSPNFSHLKELMPGAKTLAIKNGLHDLVVTEPDVVANAIIEFFSSK